MAESRTKRRQNFQNISWFLDLYRRDMLNLDPPFQRRSVWNQGYREQFIDTILLDYPAPAIFLYESIDEMGRSKFDLVDGKQRLTTVFDFVGNEFGVGEKSPLTDLRGQNFETFSKDTKISFYQYDFSVEYLPTNNVAVIDGIFDRLNRNTVKLTFQELRHAKYSGQFISAAEDLADWMTERLGKNIPRITEQPRRQMKDVEIIATLLLLLEEGPKGYSVADLDGAFAARDEEWESKRETTEKFRAVINWLAEFIGKEEGRFLPQSRLRNQADFYSLFGAIAELMDEKKLGNSTSISNNLTDFLNLVEDEESRKSLDWVSKYYEAARSASNDLGPRRTRIGTLKRVIEGTPQEPLSTVAE